MHQPVPRAMLESLQQDQALTLAFGLAGVGAHHSDAVLFLR